MNRYPSAIGHYGMVPGARYWASGFRLSSPPSRIIRNMPPTLVEFTCGKRKPESETEARKSAKYAAAVAPIGKSGVNLKLTTSFHGLGFFEDKAYAEAYYRERLEKGMEEVETTLLMLGNMKLRIASMQKQDGSTD